MKKEITQRIPGKGKICIIVLAVLLLTAVVAVYVLFYVNQFGLELQMNGDAEMILEYGEAFEDPGVRAVFSGTHFIKEGISPSGIEIQTESDLDLSKPEKYTVRYTAGYYFWTAEMSRTVRVVDTQPPVITLTEDSEENRVPGQPYVEAGFTAADNLDGDITDRVVRTESMGRITYAVSDSSGNPTVVHREVPGHDPIPPQIHLEEGEDYAIPTGIAYTEPGYRAQDNVDGDITAQVTVEGSVDCFRPGIYPITYTVTDAYGNTTTVSRNVSVTAAPRPEIRWPQDKTVYLTFDDGPGPYTERLLDILDRYRVKATFFVVDTEDAHLIKEIVRRGHSIGIHSVSHNYREIYASPEAYFADLYAMQWRIYELTGVKTTLMRFPGGSSNTVSQNTCKGIMTLLTEAVQDAGFQYFDWNVDSDDAGDTHRTGLVVDNIIRGVHETGVAVVLQHDVYDYSVEAVEDFLIWAQKYGYSFETLTPNSPPFHHPINN